MTFTKEQLQNLIEFNSSDSDGQANAESWEVHKLAEMALAGMEAEPVAYMTYKGYLLHAADPKLAEYSEPMPLYAAPQLPQPAVPDMAAVGEMPFLGTQENAFVSGWNACRAAMLQADNSPVIPDGWVACSERMPAVGEYVLCLDSGDKYQNCIPDHDDIYTAAYCDRLGSFTTEYWGDHDWMSKRSPTHWSTLPDMPAAPQQEPE